MWLPEPPCYRATISLLSSRTPHVPSYHLPFWRLTLLSPSHVPLILFPQILHAIHGKRVDCDEQTGVTGAEVEWEDWRTPCPCTGSRWRAHTGVLDPPTTVHSKLLCTPQHVVTARFPLICQPLWYSSDAPGFRYASATLTSVILRLTDGMEGIYTVPYGVCNMIDESIERVAYKLRHMSNGTAHHPDGTRKSPLIKGLLNTVRSMMHPLTNCFKLQ